MSYHTCFLKLKYCVYKDIGFINIITYINVQFSKPGTRYPLFAVKLIVSFR